MIRSTTIRDTIEPYGRVVQVTANAVRFHLAVIQPRDVPGEACGRTFWFPRRRVVPFRDQEGSTRLSVSRSYLLEKAAEAGPRQVHEEKSWVA